MNHEFDINYAAATVWQPYNPTVGLVGLSYYGSRLSLFFRIANADILASRIANLGEWVQY